MCSKHLIVFVELKKWLSVVALLTLASLVVVVVASCQQNAVYCTSMNMGCWKILHNSYILYTSNCARNYHAGATIAIIPSGYQNNNAVFLS